MHGKWLLLLSIVVASAQTTTVAAASTTTRRVLARKNKTACEWKLPPGCHESYNFRILLHFVDNHISNATTTMANKKKALQKNTTSGNNSEIVLPFPEDLKGPVKAAADLWSLAIVGRAEGKPASRLLAPLLNTIEALAAPFGATRRVRDKEEDIFRVIENACVAGSMDRSQLTHDTSYTTCSSIPTLILCVHYTSHHSERFGYSSPILANKLSLPTLAIINLNSEHEGELDFCDWTHIAAHEITHALGFGVSIIPAIRRHLGSRNTFRGTNTKREWDKLVHTGDTNTSRTTRDAANLLPPAYPFMEQDASHWSSQCVSNEMMQSGFEGFEGISLSRLTLAYMEDVGYQVAYQCAEATPLILHQTCNSKNHPTSLGRALVTQHKRWVRAHRKVRIFRRKTLRRFAKWRRKYLRIPGIRVVTYQTNRRK